MWAMLERYILLAFRRFRTSRIQKNLPPYSSRDLLGCVHNCPQPYAIHRLRSQSHLLPPSAYVFDCLCSGMSSIFPDSLFSSEAFVQHPYSKRGLCPGATDSPKRTPFPAWSVAEDVKRNTRPSQEVGSTGSKGSGPAGKIELYSGKYYASCIAGGILACGLTHAAVTPLDLAKCRLQVDPTMYKGIIDAWGKIGRAEGLRGIFTGWSPTFFGYSAQGAFKYGGYEFFKKYYSDLLGEDISSRWRTPVYLAASASAEFIADVALCPFEAVKVRMQTTIPPFARGTFTAISHVTAKEGKAGLYKGLYPLWGRQIPYTMMKFASFEKVVEMIYNYLPGKKSDYNKGAQTAVAFAGGYVAGILCAAVSHPADVMVSKLNANRLPGEGFGAAMGRIYKQIGFVGLWNGLPVRIVMVGTLTGLQWMIYDSFKIFMGLPTTGGPAPAKQKS
ncbi:hypothetical protein H113_04992 [Trichophyton rubrum MR1459]|uniref:Mitochondrial phosphate carrier protein n=4 Tax=Trichophyton TaxID=5550 RepID=F2SP52_TRIRC|nr:uncharacterized protein TERG_04714 [Trichophyton rubrum CBS 118892]EZF22138.1 hypothetical protein H100_04961 [Trichophyton rubrum MR850]EZF41181.1 hypothetical protein H102_04947 [Trichophyton rubrum CBS 100081]EZF51848.1 hypothetical protein H103_04950 [Trichophyton rubrum CBS 288.86]EZF62433.1 hypothetical protein H104_04942 [Trichophyton rubrum CBS 289.86]EZF83749.1 hypothetical protein H110_04948 [Trichophyton rubrum MR1448]EZF94458.1 hypothetical protein H113_04992 [Trichophyton rubr